MKKYILIIIIFLTFIWRVYYLNYYNHNKYLVKLEEKQVNYTYGVSAPRGRILDRNGVVLVDNIGIKTVFYSKLKGINQKDEVDIANTLASIIEIDTNIDDKVLKNYWLVTNNNGDDLITEEEWQLYKERKLNSNDLKNKKYERITNDILNKMNDIDKKSAYIYDLMNKGYSYDKKLIKKGISDLEYTNIIESNIKGITTELTWDRVYPYNDVLKDIFGTIGSIPKEWKDDYLKKGYNLNDTVGLSYLEYYYEDYLKGEKDLFKVNKDNTLTLIKSGTRGNDLVLSIDINVQKKLEELIKDNIILARERKHTDYFSESYSIVGHPKTGEIIALSGQKLMNNDLDNPEFKNVNTNLINTSYTVGSVVKMATVSTGYTYGVIDIGSTLTDSCIKLYQVPIKCSYKSLGKVNDMTAISKSSNYYQFKIAIGLTGHEYNYNMKLPTDITDFEKFRGVFKSFGLGSLTNIDLPNETTGIIGSATQSDLLLNLSIGQYDTYTPIELFQYVSTVASLGEKRNPQLMMQIKKDDKVILNNDYKVVNNVNLEEKYLNRLKEAMHLATVNGTARNYIKSTYNPAGKTGTSETFIDSDNDGVMDKKTISIAFVGFAPYDNPEYSIVVISPNLYVEEDYEYSKLYVTRYISLGITNFLFEKP